jgi:hypothetical protein
MKQKKVKIIEELLSILEQDIKNYNSDKTVECLKKLKKTCRQVVSFTVNPTTPPPPPPPTNP